MPINDKTLFIHIPKCGGHSVEAAMGIPHKKFASHEYSFKYLYGNELQHLTFLEAELILPQAAFEKSFTIVRDPVERLISEYYWSGKWTGVDAFREERVKIALERNDRNLDRHLLPQVNFISGQTTIDEIFNFGQFDEVAEFLGVKGIPHLNQKRKHVLDPGLYQELEIIARKYYSDDFDLHFSQKTEKCKNEKQYYFLKSVELKTKKEELSYLSYACEKFIIYNNAVLQNGLKNYYLNWIDIEESRRKNTTPAGLVDVDEVKIFWLLNDIRIRRGLYQYLKKLYDIRGLALKISYRYFFTWALYKLIQKALKNA